MATAVFNSPGDAKSARPNVEYNAVSVSSATVAAPNTPTLGEPAPDFVYESRDMLWQNLHNMLDQGNLLLVFGAGDDQLRSIERDREDLLRQGVVPVAIVESPDRDVWGLVRRMNLGFSLLADPHRVISEQYGVLDPTTHRTQAAWFVIDHTGRVRAANVGALPSRGWLGMTAGALGLPGANGTKSASAN